MNAQERRAAVLREIEEYPDEWMTPAHLQYAAWVEVGAQYRAQPDYWKRVAAWEASRGCSLSSFRRTAEQLLAEGLLERRNVLSGSHARFQYRKLLQPPLLE